MRFFRAARFHPLRQRADRSTTSAGRRLAIPLSRLVAVLGGLAWLALAGGPDASLSAQGCGVGINSIVCENQKPGDPASQWDVSGSGDGSIQGFATLFSAVPGEIQRFKIDTTANNYTIDIYRMGFYSGFGARRVATITPSAALPQSQPNCLSVSSTGLVDCGNWGVSASWTIPAGAVSGIYFAKLTRLDTGGASHVFFIVRDDAGRSDVLFQTSDTTWQAYNSYGGNSFYQGGPGVSPGRAYALSYNRPFNTRAASPEDWVFNAEYPMVRWLEKNGFNVSYIGGADTDRAAAELLEHKAFLSVGHDEYWSGAQRANVEAARAAGVNLAFFSGNEVYWKTRWSASVDGSNTPYRTLVSYKETHANAVIDPAHPTWTGTWRDPRFSPPADGGRPENALTGTIFRVNDGNTTSITVPSADGKHRFWRNTSVAALATGAVATMPIGTLGYEWDEAPNDAFTPSGLMRLSTTTRNVTSMLLDFGSSFGAGTATHNLTLYRHPNGALVFGAGTVQWSWGLDASHDRGSAAADVRMKQATVNLFADMQVLPSTLEAGLAPATPSSDVTAPTSTITSPAAGASVPSGTTVTISGTAADAGGGIVGGVEVSVNGGATWSRATGTTSWTYSWVASGLGSVSIQSRAFDDTGNLETPSAGRSVTVTAGQVCPCTIWAPSSVPPIADDLDPAAVEVGTRFRSDLSGYITAIRFYKAPLNTGIHTGRLWTNTGTLLATVTFTGETASGWQQAALASAVPITANTTYLVTYHAPNGHYTGTDNFFATSALDNAPLHGLRGGVDGANGVYRYGSGGVFPTDTYLSEGYWADVVFSTVAPPDSTRPTVTAFFPASGAGGIDPATVVTATFSEAMDPATISSSTTGAAGEGGASLGTFELRDPLNSLVNATVSYEPTTRVATLRPDASLRLSTTYTVVVKGGAVDPRVKDLAGNALATNATWTFTTAAAPPPPPTCPCTIWTPTTVPQKIDDGDPNSVELGTRFRSDVAGFITGARFYKGSLNTGTHIAKLWTNAGVLLGSATFTGETASGWQETAFTTPIAIAANTTYMISYHANNGRYSSQAQLFATAGVDRGPLHALRDGVDGANGVYQYGASVFPTQTFQSEGYFIDVVFNTTNGPDVTAPTVTSVGPIGGISGVGTGSNVLATFNENMNAATITTTSLLLRNPSNVIIPASVTYNSSTRTATLDPTSALAYLTTYTAVVKGGAVDPRVKDAAGNALASDYTWSFTTAAPPPPPPTQGPGGPVLVVTSAANPFSTYLAEILRTEGLNAFTTADLTTITAGTLSGYDLVILGEMPLSAGQVTMFTDWVTQGGNLVAMRPDKQLAGLMGLTDAAATLANAYLLVNTAAAPGAGIVNQTMQFHGTADRYTLNGAAAIATLYSTANVATANPAVTMRTVGAGYAVAFTYDLARSVVYTRQGNPAWSGQERDGLVPIRSNDFFFGAKAGDVQPDWVDFSKIAIPQADEQQRLLWNIMLHTNSAKRPLPRFWYFPRMLKAVVIMTGDDHANGGTAGRFDQYLSLSAPGCSVADWTCIRGTSYLFPATPIAPAQVSNYVAQGFELGLHVNTQCADYTAASLQTDFSTQLTQFATAFPTVPPPATNRTHCIVFSDYATQPQVSLANGIRFDTNYYYWPATWVLDRPGMFTGSGMPMRFAATTGSMIDVYQATSQLTDESGMSYAFHADTLFNRALGAEGYYGAFTANMHTDFNPSEGQVGSDAIIASAQARGVPVIAAKQMLDWLDGRNGSSFKSITWAGNRLGFEIAVGANATGLHTLVPATANGAQIQGLTVNSAAVPFALQTIKGVSYAVFAAQSGTYQASYGVDFSPPVITAVSATPSTSSATVQWTTNEAADSRVEYGTDPAALAQSVFNTAAAMTHSLALSNLQAGTTYYYRVRSTDAANNQATSPALANPPASFSTAAPMLAITDATVVEGNSGTSFAAFTVTLSAATSQPVTVTYATADGSATAGLDYAAASGTVTLSPGTTSAVLNVTVTGDTVYEPNETFAVNLSAPVNAALADSQAIGTITNDDGLPALSISDATVIEGNAGSQNTILTVTLSGSSSQTVTIAYATANGTATAGSDYVAQSGTLTFLPGVTSQPLSTSITGDTLNESNETFVVNLSAPVNASLADGQGTVTITNDDAAPAISIADVSVAEGNAGTTTATFTLTLSAVSGNTVTVGYATANGTATAGSDYVATSGTATFAPGSISTTVNLTINGDATLELDETLVVDLSGATNATVADAQATGTILNDEAPPALSISDLSINEGDAASVNATLTVSLSGASPQTVTVNYATANGTATAGSDYTAASGVVTFLPGVISQPITIPVLGDVTDEPNETFVVNLSAPANATLADSQGLVTITDDDLTPTLAITDVSIMEGNAGSSSAALTVTLSSASGFSVTVGYATADGSATVAGGDYLAASGTLTFAPGVTSQSVTVPVSGDTVDEANETFTVNLSAPANATLADALGVVTITDDDPQPSISIADVALAEGNSGTATAAFTLTLSAVSGNTVTVGYATTNGTATAGSDYVAGTGTATFAPGSIRTTVNVTINGDGTLELDETFVVDLSGATNASIADAQATGTILNDEAPPALSISDLAVIEGHAGSVNAILTVALSEASPQTVTVNYATANATATAGSDYTAASGVVTFLPGVISQQITIAVLGDATDEPNETFVVNLSAPANATLADPLGVATITDDDPQPSIAIADMSLAEGNSGTTTAAFTLTLSAVSGNTVTVGYATTNGTATAGSDYVAGSGTATFAPGAISTTVNVTINGDATLELDETFVVDLSGATNASIADAQATGTIVNDEAPPALSISDLAVIEGNTGSANAILTVSLSGASPQTVTVNYATADGTATAGSDYTAASGVVTFLPGVISQPITFQVIGDVTDEPNDTFVVNLSAPVNATVADPQGTVTITDDDVAPTLAITDVSITEGNVGNSNAAFTVTLSSPSGFSVTVGYATANGTATAGSDYVAGSGTATFAPGAISTTVNVTINGDGTLELDETFVVDLSGATNAGIADAQATGTILNDEAPPALSISDLAVIEGNIGSANAILTVSLSGASPHTVTVSYATADGTATAGSDYTAASGVVTFLPGVISQPITFQVIGDVTDEPNETFVVNLSAPVSATLADSQGIVTISDDDPQPAISIADMSLAEGNSGTTTAAFTLTLSAVSGNTVTVGYATTNGTATAGSDYVAGSGTATFAPGAISTTVNVTINGDATLELDETFVVDLSGATNAGIADAQATGTILNDEAPPALSISDLAMIEGHAGSANAILTVSLSGASPQTVTVNYATADGTATAGSDYTAASGVVTFLPGVISQPITFQVIGDVTDEPNDTFVVNLSAPVSATLADSQGIVTITDDDATPTLAITDVSITEGNAGTTNATFTLTLSTASGQPVTVGYATTDGTATAGSDYVAGSGTATFTPGVVSTTVNVTINGDPTLEADETFGVTLSAPANATITDGVATGTILNDDGLPAVSISDAIVTEGNSGSANASLTVSLSTPGVQTVTVSYASADGTATAGSDYVAVSGSVTFLPGVTSQSITIPVNGDTADEPNETFAVNLSAPVNATLADPQGTVTITDDDPTPSLTISDVSVVEGNGAGTNAVFAVTLSGASGSTVTVSYATANGSATAGADYTAGSGSLSFAPGETSKVITIPVTGDALDEADESFVINLTTPANATLADAQATGTITDDDLGPSISIANLSLTEGNSATKVAAFALTLSAASGQTVTVGYATANGTATAGSDYVAATGTATFAAGATTATVNVTINGDTTYELNETFVVDLSAPTNATIATIQATGTLTNDDALPALSITDATIVEGNTGTVTANLNVTLSAVSSQTVTVAYATADGTATAGTDYTAASGTLTFLPGAISQPIALSITGDTGFELGETVLVNLTAPVNATVADSQGVVTISNDDSGSVPGLVAAYGFSEGSGTTTADASSGGQTGSISGATWTAAGKNGNALSFDGVNDMVSVADTAALDVTRTTVMAWLRPTNLAEPGTAVMKERPAGAAYALYANDVGPRPSGYVNVGGSDAAALAPAGLVLNTWTHVAMTYDGANLRLYVNGTLVRTTAQTGNIVASALPLRIGGNTIWNEYFAGRIDDVRIYNRALTLAEVQSMMNVAVTP